MNNSPFGGNTPAQDYANYGVSGPQDPLWELLGPTNVGRDGVPWATGAEHIPTVPVPSEFGYGNWPYHPTNAKLESPQLASTPPTPADGYNSSHNPGSSADGEEYTDPMARKRAKNAEAARKTARLKKERQNKLEEQVNLLQRQVEGLHGKRDELQHQRDVLMERAEAAYRAGNVGRR